MPIMLLITKPFALINMEITIPSFTLTLTNFALITVSGIYIAASIWIVFWKVMSGSYSILDTPNLANKKYFIIFFPGWIFWTIIFGALSLVMITYQKIAGKN
jgi:hypothetical protein